MTMTFTLFSQQQIIPFLQDWGGTLLVALVGGITAA